MCLYCFFLFEISHAVLLVVVGVLILYLSFVFRWIPRVVCLRWKREKFLSMFIEMLGLQVGEQSRLMAITRLRHCDDQVMVSTRGYFVQSFKLCYDEADDTVYALAHLDDLSKHYRGFKSRVRHHSF